MRVDLLDAPAYSPQYDHALAVALARAGARVRLITSRFAYGAVAEPDGYGREEAFYRHGFGPPGSRRRALTKRVQHVPDLLAYRRRTDLPDVVHLQWQVLLDLALMPDRPTVLTVHDPHGVTQRIDRADAVIVHTEHARTLLAPRVDPGRIHVIHHGPLEQTVAPGPLPPELEPPGDHPVVLMYGLLRPYKGVDLLLEAWRQVSGADLWIVGRPMMKLSVPDGIGYVPRYVSPAEQAAVFAAADIVVLPYRETDRFGFSGVLATAMADAKPIIASALGSHQEVIATGAVRPVPTEDPAALAAALQDLIDRPAERHRLGAAAQQAAITDYSWSSAAERTLAIYRTLR